VTRLALQAVADGLMTEVVNHYTDSGVELPERRLLVPGAPGAVAWDCEQVTLAISAVQPSASGAQFNVMPKAGAQAGVMLTRQVTWAIQVVRCSPTSGEDGEPPGAAELGGAAMASLIDVAELSQCMIELASLTPGTRDWLEVGTTINAGTTTPLGPEGGFQAVEASVIISAMVTE
jgi:hypothetical protein